MTRAIVLVIACLLPNVFPSAQPSASRANESFETQRFTAPDLPYGQAALAEGGWLFFSGILESTARTSHNSNAKRHGFTDAAHSALARSAHPCNPVLDLAAQLQAVKCDRAGSRTTAIPPPSA